MRESVRSEERIVGGEKRGRRETWEERIVGGEKRGRREMFLSSWYAHGALNFELIT